MNGTVFHGNILYGGIHTGIIYLWCAVRSTRGSVCRLRLYRPLQERVERQFYDKKRFANTYCLVHWLHTPKQNFRMQTMLPTRNVSQTLLVCLVHWLHLSYGLITFHCRFLILCYQITISHFQSS